MQSNAQLQQLQQLTQALGVAGIVAIVLLIVLVVLAIVAIEVAICYFLMTCFQRIPREFRKQEPAMVWLLMIPCFRLVWSFFVFPKLAESYQAYFASVGRTEFGDCGRSLGLYFCFAGVAYVALIIPTMIPFIGTLFSLTGCLVLVAALVLLIIFLVKAGSLKGQIPETPAA